MSVVSVVLATNRSRPHLHEAIASVAAQSHAATELIVVDDGSDDPDEIERLVAEVSGARVVRQRAAGVSAARNRGAALAGGDYLVFLDDDDVWRSDRLARHVEAMRERPSAVASYCAMRSVDAVSGAVLAPGDQRAIVDRLDVARRTTGIIAPNLFLSRAAFEAVGGFDESLRYAEDLDLALRLSERGSFAFVPQVLVDYRVTSHNVTGRHRELVSGIDGVLRAHRARARRAGDGSLVRALDDSIRKNERFAWWGAWRRSRASLRARRYPAAAADLLWAARVAPRGLVSGMGRRIAGFGRRESEVGS